MPERKFQPDWFSKPGDTLVELLNRRRLSPITLSELMGCSVQIVRGILAGTVHIDSELATRLARAVGGTPSFWKSRQAAYDASLDRAVAAVSEAARDAWLGKLPGDAPSTFGWVEPSKNDRDKLRSYLAFFGVSGPGEWEVRYARFQDDIAFRTSPKFPSRIGPVSAWLRQSEIEAALLPCAPWNSEHLKNSLEALRRLTKIKSPALFAPKLRALCAAAGVAVVIVRAPSGCRASGAARFISPDKAMVALSYRYRSDDHFWFTFFHEIGHLILHGTASTFVDGEEVTTSKMELEANHFAAATLVPHNRHDELLSLPPKRDSIIRFAVSLGICPGIVVGQMQHLNVIGRNQMNFLKRRYNWDEIESASI